MWPSKPFFPKTLLTALSFGMMAALLLPSIFGCAAKTATPPPLTLITEEALPMNYTENGQVTGLATDVVRGIMTRLGVSYNIQMKPWSEGYDMVQKQADMALFATARTAAREDLFQWVGPIASHLWAFFARSDSTLNIASLDDARKVGSIAVYKDDARAQYLAAQGFTNLVTVADAGACLIKAASGEADLAAVSDLAGLMAARRVGLDPADLKIAYIFNQGDLYIAFNKDTPKDVVQSWQQALDAMNADGMVAAIEEHWRAQMENMPFSTPAGLAQAKLSLQGVLDKLDGDVEKLAAALSETGISGDVARQELERFVAGQPGLIDIVTVSPAGRIVTVAPYQYAGAEGADISGQSHVISMTRDHQPVLSPRFMTVEGVAAVVLARPVFSPSGEYLGSVNAVVDPLHLAGAALDGVTQTSGQKYFVLETGGMVLYDRDGAEVGKNILTDAPFTATDTARAAFKQTLTEKEGRSPVYLFPVAGGEPATRVSTWGTVSLHGTAWRLGYGATVPRLDLTGYTFLTEEYAPFNFTADGRLQGITVDLMELMFNRLDSGLTRDDIKVTPWAAAYQQAQQQPRTVLFAMIRNAEREDLFKWAGPIAADRTVAFVPQGNPDDITSLEGLRRYRVGVARSDNSELLLKAAGLGGANLVVKENVAELIAAMRNGEIDAWVYGEDAGRTYLKDNGADPNQFDPAFVIKEENTYFAFHKETPDEVIAAFQQALDELKQEKGPDGTSLYEQVLARYTAPRYIKDSITAEQVMALVAQTASDIGRDTPATLRRVTAREAPYKDATDPALYVFVYDVWENMVAHGDNASMVGHNYRNKTDVTGNAFRDKIAAGALAQGSGWQDYVYTRPGDGGLFYKTTYYQLVTGSDGGQYIVCAGRFKDAP